MSVKIGISLIAWQNDDLPELTAAFTTEGAMEDAARIGYQGVERGRRMPADTDGLRAYLDRYGVSLCGGWCSGNLMVNDLATEKAAIRQQVEQFAALKAPCIVYAECSNTIQGDVATPVSRRPKLGRDEVLAYAARLSDLAKWSADQGVALAYHHHMGAMVQDAEDIDWLMEGSGDDLKLLYDTGHLHFAGADALAVLDRWGHRVHHVHFKDVRQPFWTGSMPGIAVFSMASRRGSIPFPGIRKAASTFRPSPIGWPRWTTRAGSSSKPNRTRPKPRPSSIPNWGSIKYTSSAAAPG